MTITPVRYLGSLRFRCDDVFLRVEEIEASFSNLLCPSPQGRIKLPKLRSLILQHSVDFFRHLLTIELPSLEDLLIEGIYDDSDMRDFLPELSNPHDRDSVRLRVSDGSLPQFLHQAKSRMELIV